MPSVRETLVLLDIILRLIPPTALLQHPELTGSLEEASKSQNPYLFAHTFYMITAPDSPSSLPEGSTPIVSSLNGVTSLISVYAHGLAAVSRQDIPGMRENLSLALQLLHLLAERITSTVQLKWIPERWLQDLLNCLDHEVMQDPPIHSPINKSPVNKLPPNRLHYFSYGYPPSKSPYFPSILHRQPTNNVQCSEEAFVVLSCRVDRLSCSCSQPHLVFKQCHKSPPRRIHRRTINDFTEVTEHSRGIRSFWCSMEDHWLEHVYPFSDVFIDHCRGSTATRVSSESPDDARARYPQE